jgi:alpha-amylase
MRLFTKKTALRATVLLGAAALALTTAIQPSMADTTVVPAPNKQITNQSVGAQMFMWPFKSLKTECTKVLGPEHLDWIMVSPPQEDVTGNQWWVHYQPVSYKLDSQLGTPQEFADMVAACNTAGVQVVVDAVINHMANSSGKGFAGTSFSKYYYPGLYEPEEFHNGLDVTDPNYCEGNIDNYNDPFQIVHCELGGLPDLTTEKEKTRDTIAAYLNHLIDLGVAGFRVDAAKHIGITDMTAIVNKLKPVNGQKPYILSETVGDVTTNQPFTAIGDVFSWDWQDQFSNIFSGQTGLGRPSDSRKELIGDPNKTIIMVSNHDTEHHGPTAITYRDPKRYQAASAFLVSDALGKPMLYTGYAFGDENDGPPAASNGYYKPAVCPKVSNVPSKKYKAGTFICMDRWTSVKGMIQWRHEVGTAEMTNALSENQVLSFTRGTGFFAMHTNAAVATKATINTGLPAGVYCDVYTGGAKAKKAGGKCVGTRVVVGADGTAKLSLPAMTVIAIDATNKTK